MKKAAVLIILGFLGTAGLANATIPIRAGLAFGPRTIQDSAMGRVYGQGLVLWPNVEANIWKGFTIGTAYEIGVPQSGTIGLEKSGSTFRMSGWNLYLGWDVPAGSIVFFGRFGYGLYYYKQTIENPEVAAYKVDRSQSTVLLAAGVRFPLDKTLFVTAAAHYVPLSVRPFDVAVNLGGWRFLVGAGFAIVR